MHASSILVPLLFVACATPTAPEPPAPAPARGRVLVDFTRAEPVLGDSHPVDASARAALVAACGPEGAPEPVPYAHRGAWTRPGVVQHLAFAPCGEASPFQRYAFVITDDAGVVGSGTSEEQGFFYVGADVDGDGVDEAFVGSGGTQMGTTWGSARVVSYASGREVTRERLGQVLYVGPGDSGCVERAAVIFEAAHALLRRDQRRPCGGTWTDLGEARLERDPDSSP